MIKYYKSAMWGGTKEDRDDFYSTLKEVQENSCGSFAQWDGDYLKTTYKMYDGTQVIYKENMEYGIPSSIETED